MDTKTIGIIAVVALLISGGIVIGDLLHALDIVLRKHPWAVTFLAISIITLIVVSHSRPPSNNRKREDDAPSPSNNFFMKDDDPDYY